jgi:NAD(P)-dependent dehydrogenase (short-subunit alcohol dehydrogenase family)
MHERLTPLAFVTGGSSGIGFELARPPAVSLAG